jgi:parvulin-like peptidyl-prolyl isomerase
VIEQAIFNKMLLMEFERTMPPEVRSDPKKRAEAEGKIKKQIQRAFDESLTSAREQVAAASPEEIEKLMRQDATVMRLALLMKERHLESPGELDAALRQYGTSLDMQIRDFGEYMMGMEAARTNLGLGKSEGKSKVKKAEITLQDMLDYYQAHIADYQIPAKARFEILTAKFSKFAGNRIATHDAIARMGNEVILGGTPFPAVARKQSQEPHASDGGYYDWVNPGSLASKPIDQAVFSLEVDKLSQIIEDDQGYHIVHVLERKPAGQVSFQEAQPEIRNAIKKERTDSERQKYLTNLRARTKVWTIFDPPIDGAAQPALAPR